MLLMLLVCIFVVYVVVGLYICWLCCCWFVYLLSILLLVHIFVVYFVVGLYICCLCCCWFIYLLSILLLVCIFAPPIPRESHGATFVRVMARKGHRDLLKLLENIIKTTSLKSPSPSPPHSMIYHPVYGYNRRTLGHSTLTFISFILQPDS